MVLIYENPQLEVSIDKWRIPFRPISRGNRLERSLLAETIRSPT